MLVGLGRPEVDSILAERSLVEVACEFCGQQYRFDAVDAVQIFADPSAVATPPASAPGNQLH